MPNQNNDSALQNVLLNVIRDGKYNSIEALLRKRLSINFVSHDGKFPLLFAVKYRYTSIVELLIEHGCDVNLTPPTGHSALHEGAIQGDVRILRILLKAKGANVDVLNSIQRTPLFLAVARGHTETVKLLLERGASVNVCDNLCRTPLHWAALGGHLKVSSLLLDYGADINAANFNRETALIVALGEGHVDLASYFIETGKCHINHVTKSRGTHELMSGFTALHVTARDGYEDIARDLIMSGAGVNIIDATLRPPIHWASSEGHLGIVNLLIQTGACVNLNDYQDSTPLYEAVENSHSAVVALLLDNKAKVDDHHEKGHTPLTRAVYQCSTAIVCSLLQHNADPNLPTRNGSFPLDVAMLGLHHHIVAMLALAGAKIYPSRKVGYYTATSPCLAQFWNRPAPLRHQCRIVVRRLLGRNVLWNVESLPLPQSLRSYIRLKELESFL